MTKKAFDFKSYLQSLSPRAVLTNLNRKYQLCKKKIANSNDPKRNTKYF